MNRFSGQTAIVTGAARGIGRAIAERLAAEGATVALADINEAGVQATAAEIGGDSFGVGADIAEPESVTALHRAVIDKTGQLDVLVNAAAIEPVRVRVIRMQFQPQPRLQKRPRYPSRRQPQ